MEIPFNEIDETGGGCRHAGRERGSARAVRGKQRGRNGLVENRPANLERSARNQRTRRARYGLERRSRRHTRHHLHALPDRQHRGGDGRRHSAEIQALGYRCAVFRGDQSARGRPPVESGAAAEILFRPRGCPMETLSRHRRQLYLVYERACRSRVPAGVERAIDARRDDGPVDERGRRQRMVASLQWRVELSVRQTLVGRAFRFLPAVRDESQFDHPAANGAVVKSVAKITLDPLVTLVSVNYAF